MKGAFNKEKVYFFSNFSSSSTFNRKKFGLELILVNIFFGSRVYIFKFDNNIVFKFLFRNTIFKQDTA